MQSLRTYLFRSFLFVITVLVANSALAQDNLIGGWAAWFNGVRLKESNFGIHTDVQFRVGRDWSNSSVILIRPGINYHLDNKQVVSIGYASTLITDRLNDEIRRLNEHRIWEQYVIQGRLYEIPAQHRFRLEQRFLRMQEEIVFTHRARYFIRGIIPLGRKTESAFTQGMFMSLQNELFLNVQNRTALNKGFLDQNRFYSSIGHRFMAKYDGEIGYMNQLLVGNDFVPTTFAHIIQVAFYSRF